MVLVVVKQGGWTAITVAKSAQMRVGKDPLGSQETYLKISKVTA
jgi:hypothetical protein